MRTPALVAAREGLVGGLDTQRHRVHVELNGQVGGDGLDQVLEGSRAHDGEHRGVNAGLAREIAAADGDQIAVLALQAADFPLQTYHHEALHVDRAFALLAPRRHQPGDQLGVLREEVGMPAEILRDLGAGEAREGGGFRAFRLAQRPAFLLLLPPRGWIGRSSASRRGRRPAPCR
jgi:hypothetical protein